MSGPLITDAVDDATAAVRDAITAIEAATAAIVGVSAKLDTITTKLAGGLPAALVGGKLSVTAPL